MNVLSSRSASRADPGPVSANTAAQIYVIPGEPLRRSIGICSGRFWSTWDAPFTRGFTNPESKLSDENGFRKDVMGQIRKLGVPIIRYPGGNFVSGYNWLDGVGPKQERPEGVLIKPGTLDSNQFGTNEFMAWCKLVGNCAVDGAESWAPELPSKRRPWWSIAT